MPKPPDLTTALSTEPLLRPVDRQCITERRLWRACELCTFLEYRVASAPEPQDLSEEAIAAWATRGLAPGEHLVDAAAMVDDHPFWILADGEPVGTIALRPWYPGWGYLRLRISSLYVLRHARGRGHASRLMSRLEALSPALGFGGIRLDTDWLWQPAVRFYLQRGFHVVNWKHTLSLARHLGQPSLHVHTGDRRMAVLLGDQAQPCISAWRAGARLVWDEEPWLLEHPELWSEAAQTLSLWLATRGWPLIRDPMEWEHGWGWADGGMPEGLGRKIEAFEAYARHRGFRVDTPKIPGLDYPTWEQLKADPDL